MLNPPCFDCQYLLKIVDEDNIRCKGFPTGTLEKILQAVGFSIQRLINN
jgi:hypothetical protein